MSARPRFYRSVRARRVFFTRLRSCAPVRAPRGAPSSSPRNSSTGPHPTVLGSNGVSGSWFLRSWSGGRALHPPRWCPILRTVHSGQCGTLVKLREPDGGRLRYDYARAQASGVRCVPLLVETFGGLSPRASSHSVRRRSGARSKNKR